MSNTNDQAVLVDPSDVIVDATSWGNTFAFNPGVDITGNIDGQSIYRINPYTDTNTASDWQLFPSTTATPSANRSTPGTVPVPEPSTVVLLLGSVVAGFGLRRR
jgi:hypothetical protein